MEYKLVMNGVGPAWMRIFGCDCSRCLQGDRDTNVSASLIAIDDAGNTAYHVLFDVGSGVADSLVENPYLRGRKARLDWLVLTHWHPDHIGDMNRLLASYHDLRRFRDGAALPIPLWCRQGTAEWVQRRQHYDWDNFLTYQGTAELNAPGVVLPPLPLPLPGLTVTPITVAHRNADVSALDGRLCYACAAYVIETANAKIVLLWDLDTENNWLLEPENEMQQTAVSHLANADYLFIDCAYWSAQPQPMNHTSFSHVRRYGQCLSPRQTMLIHVSGHSDGPGNPGYGWTNQRWQEEARLLWTKDGLPGQVSVPERGGIYNL